MSGDGGMVLLGVALCLATQASSVFGWYVLRRLRGLHGWPTSPLAAPSRAAQPMPVSPPPLPAQEVGVNARPVIRDINYRSKPLLRTRRRPQ